jgi:RHS repeat-associated protein
MVLRSMYSVPTNGSAISLTQFVYDGDGSRVLQLLPDGSQTAYASALEVSITGTQRITKTYYSAGSQLIAMRQFTTPTSSVLYFLHSDHLGSTSLTTDQNGNALTRQSYDAWGNVRYVTGTLPTDIGFTGQRLDNSTGLMYYGARYYAQGLGRFISADTIVPSPSNPQSLNRFSYTRNNPLKYIDPSGHVDCDKSQYGNDCQSSSAHEKEQADAHNNLCAYDQTLCQWGTGAGEVAALLAIGGIGLIGGALIGVGAELIGSAAIATGGAAAATTSGLFGSGLVGAGVGLVAGAGGTVVNEVSSGQRLDPTDILINSVDTAGAGFVSGIIPGSGGWALAARVGFNGLFAAHASVWSDIAHDRPIDGKKAALSGSLTAGVSALAGVGANVLTKIYQGMTPQANGASKLFVPYSSLAKQQGSMQATKAAGYGLINAFAVQIPLYILATPR